MTSIFLCFPLFFFNATAPTEIYTLSLHDALPIFASVFEINRAWRAQQHGKALSLAFWGTVGIGLLTWVAYDSGLFQDRKSTRLNSSHMSISYAVFCLKKKKK